MPGGTAALRPKLFGKRMLAGGTTPVPARRVGSFPITVGGTRPENTGRAHVLVAGVDSSTQSTKVLLCEAGDGTIVAQGSAPHPGGTECPPQAWWDALQQAGEGLLSQAAAVGVAGQQHGMVVLDDDGEVIRPALLWNDLRSAAAASALIAERGGPAWWAELRRLWT